MRRSPKHILLLLLGLWFALAPALYAMPAAAMMAPDGIAMDSGSDGCSGCPDLDDDAAGCAQLCLAAAAFAIFPDSGRLLAAAHGCCLPARHSALAGFYSGPDPAPPKSLPLQ